MKVCLYKKFYTEYAQYSTPVHWSSWLLVMKIASQHVRKRKRTMLTIQEKVDICKLIDNGTSYTVICDTYGIGRSTVSDIKKSEHKLKSFSHGHGEKFKTGWIRAIGWGIIYLVSPKNYPVKSLLRDLLLTQEQGIIAYLKGLNILKVISLAWEEITIGCSWQKLIPIVDEESSDDVKLN